MSHLFCSRIGSYRLLLQMDYLTRCPPWLLLGLDLMLLFFWLTEFFSFTDLPIYLMTEAFLLSSLPQYHWLLFHHIAEEIQISSFLGIIFAYDAFVVVVLLLVWLVMSSTFFFFFLYIIGILFKMSCCYTFYLVTLFRR
jgi:hypothetical protein